ncbi:MAG: hypothetical protein U1F29_17465 [Planctomycetota bacterium]
MKVVIPNRLVRRARRGSALVAALFVVLMVGTLSMAYLQMSVSKNKEQQTAADAKRAFYVAEAGLAEAYSGLVIGKSGNVGSDVVPARFGNGVFWVVAESVGTNKTVLTSTGLCGTGRTCVSLVVENRRPPVASQGVLGAASVNVQAGAVIDSYDSRGGGGGGAVSVGGLTLSGGATTSGSGTNQARITSNGSITVQGTTTRSAGATVQGSAHPGPSGVVNAGSGATITGSTTPSTALVALPEVRYPDVESSGSVNHSQSSPALTVPSGRHAYDTLELSGSGAATLTGPLTLVVDRLVLGAGTQLTINALAGPVRVYVRDWMKFAQGSTVVCASTDPTKTSIVCGGSETIDRDGDGVLDPPVTLGSTGSFYGAVYAPHASFTLANTLTLYGAIAAQTLTVAGGGHVHFDVALVDAPSEEGADPASLGWRLVQLPPARLVESRTDPLLYLKLRGVTPVPSKLAHYDVGVTPVTAITKPWFRTTIVP